MKQKERQAEREGEREGRRSSRVCDRVINITSKSSVKVKSKTMWYSYRTNGEKWKHKKEDRPKKTRMKDKTVEKEGKF